MGNLSLNGARYMYLGRIATRSNFKMNLLAGMVMDEQVSFGPIVNRCQASIHNRVEACLIIIWRGELCILGASI